MVHLVIPAYCQVSNLLGLYQRKMLNDFETLISGNQFNNVNSSQPRAGFFRWITFECIAERTALETVTFAIDVKN